MIAALDGPVGDPEADLTRPAWGRLIAVLGVAVVAAALAVLPVLLAAGVAARGGREVVAGFASLVAVVGGVKLAAMAWGLAASAD